MKKNLKEEILKTAQTFFYEKGYQETTMRDIASALRISLGNLTYHFHKKEDLMIALLKWPDFLNQPLAATFEELFELIRAMIESLIVNRFFYTEDELGRATPEFYRHNVDTVSRIENHLEQSLQQLSDQGWLIPWTSEQERHAFTRMIMDSHIVWIKNSFYREAQDQISYADFLDIHWYLLESHVQKEKLTEYQRSRSWLSTGKNPKEEK